VILWAMALESDDVDYEANVVLQDGVKGEVQCRKDEAEVVDATIATRKKSKMINQTFLGHC
jgi:hypothetical protein